MSTPSLRMAACVSPFSFLYREFSVVISDKPDGMIEFPDLLFDSMILVSQFLSMTFDCLEAR